MPIGGGSVAGTGWIAGYRAVRSKILSVTPLATGLELAVSNTVSSVSRPLTVACRSRPICLILGHVPCFSAGRRAPARAVAAMSHWRAIWRGGRSPRRAARVPRAAPGAAFPLRQAHGTEDAARVSTGVVTTRVAPVVRALRRGPRAAPEMGRAPSFIRPSAGSPHFMSRDPWPFAQASRLQPPRSCPCIVIATGSTLPPRLQATSEASSHEGGRHRTDTRHALTAGPADQPLGLKLASGPRSGSKL